MNKIKSAILACVAFLLFVVVAMSQPAPSHVRADSDTPTPTPTATDISGGNGGCHGDPGTC